MNRLRSVLDLASSVAVIIAAVVLVWTLVASPRAAARSGKRADPLPSAPLSLKGAAIDGTATAPAVLVMFSDFQCPFCSRFASEILPTLRRTYVDTGRMAIAFRHFPLGIHRFAQDAAVAAECALRQDKFWQMHDRLFQNQKALDRANLISSAAELRLDGSAFEQCLGGDAASTVQADVQLGKSLAITGTPTIFVGRRLPDNTVQVTRRLTGALPIAEFADAIDVVTRK